MVGVLGGMELTEYFHKILKLKHNTIKDSSVMNVCHGMLKKCSRITFDTKKRLIYYVRC